jgi:hypothetical protein
VPAGLLLLMSLASCDGCSERAPNVCCTSDTECAELGLPPGSVSDYSCGQGHVCRDFYCVTDEGPDAGTPDAAVDAPIDASSGRCNPSSPFETPVRLASVSSQFDDLSIAVTHDELKAYFVRHTGTDFVITASRRESVESDFPAPVTDPALAAIAAGPDLALYPYPTSDDLVVYYRRGSTFFVSYRLASTDPFNVGTDVYVNGHTIFGHRVMISADALTLYWSGPSVPLRAATYGGAANIFVAERAATTFDLTDFAISADQLTLYYSNFPNPDIFVSTRASRDTPFGVGVPVANVNTSAGDIPMDITADGCLLYIRSNRPGTDGSNDFWVARRGPN